MSSSKDKKTGSTTSRIKDIFEIREPGWKKLQTTSLFRVTNFELYAKPHMGTMLIGATAFLGCVGFILYMRVTAPENSYTAMNEDGTLTRRSRSSKWD